MSISIFRADKGVEIVNEPNVNTVQFLTDTSPPNLQPEAINAPIGSLWIVNHGSPVTTKIYQKINVVTSSSADWQDATNPSGLSSWRKPVEVVDTVDVVLPSGTPGNPIVIDGVPITNQQRVLFTNLGIGDNNVYIYNQPTGIFIEDTQIQANGDTVYVIQGTFSTVLFSYNSSAWVITDQLIFDELALIRTFIGKSAPGNVTPAYTSTNFVSGGSSLETAIGALDTELGPNVVSNGLILSTNKINENIQTVGNFVINDGKVASASNVTSITTIDSVLAICAKWIIRIVVNGDSSRVHAYEILATHNGVIVSSVAYSSLNIGIAPIGLQITITLSGGNTLNLNVQSTTSVDVQSKRVAAF